MEALCWTVQLLITKLDLEKSTSGIC